MNNNNFKANIEFSAKIAKGFHKKEYYESTGYSVNNLEEMEQEKEKLKTEDKEIVTKKIDYFVKLAGDSTAKVFEILEKIFIKNQNYAFNKTDIEPLNCDLLVLLANEDILRVAYKKVRKNRGAMTQAYLMSKEKYDSLNPEQKSWANKTAESPDGINREVFRETIKLIKNNNYPWGASRRIYVDKPGKKDSKRPITIPPFMDKVVQEAMTMILMAIYEPYFEKRNCSFGFRPNKGVHDSLIPLTEAKAVGMTNALEGDIKSAYDKVNKDKLIEILNKKIKDKKFLKFIRSRLDYEYYDTKEEKYIKDDLGLPQGGIDSPYMWNIYMMVFDDYIIDFLNEETERLNIKVRGEKKSKKVKGVITTEKRLNERRKTTIRRISDLINKEIKNKNINLVEKLELLSEMTTKEIIKQGILTGELNGIKKILKDIGVGKIKDIKIIFINLRILGEKLQKEGNKMPSNDPNKLQLRFIYVRYADDWIILTNIKKELMEQIKTKISIFLKDELHAELSMEKTLLTNIRESSAHFLGYEIKTYKHLKVSTYLHKSQNKKRQIKIKAIVAGRRVFAIPDRQRLINRLHMKGYCDKRGFPREIGFLSSLDDFSIIERYNSVLTGLALYYTEFVKNPKKNLSRWIFIIRYSCIKTLAQKHKTTVRKIFAMYREDKERKTKGENTIIVKVINNIQGIKMSKTWRLKTLDDLITSALSLKRKTKLNDIYWTLEKGEPCTYEDKKKYRITNDNFCEKINWINIRTQASFDMPCSICGSEEEIQMHHIKHVRKNRYDLINKDQTWLQAMYLRNRKQIPVCKECHINVIHRGTYGGTKLIHYCPKIMCDNRIITIESHITKAALNKNKIIYANTLQEKGWKLENPSEEQEL